LREVQRVMPDNLPTLNLMGAVKFQQGQLSQAEANLERYLAREPGNESAARLLASARFQQRDFEGVVDALAPLVRDLDPQGYAGVMS